jgi:hypothetical protein
MIPSASPRQRSSERGEITWVTLVLLLSLVTAGYLAVVWVPVYIIRYEAGVVTNEYANKAIRDGDDAQLVNGLCDRLAKLDQVRAPQADGSVAMEPAVQVRPQEVTWERNTSVKPPTLHVAFEYTTSVYYPLLDRFTEKTFAVDRLQDIAMVRW